MGESDRSSALRKEKVGSHDLIADRDKIEIVSEEAFSIQLMSWGAGTSENASDRRFGILSHT